MSKQKQFQKMKIYHANAAGIDIGSAFQIVATGLELKDVEKFGVYTEDHRLIIEHLKKKKVTTVAMESTGSYWQTLFIALQTAGFEVLLADGAQTKVYKRKTDVKDARAIFQLHSLGLLNSCFLPDNVSLEIRNLTRHRATIIEEDVRLKNRIQKDLRLMNLRLDIAFRDPFGKSGKTIIELILSGETDPTYLASFADERVKKSKSEIAKSLEGQYDNTLLFLIEDNYASLQNNESRIEKIDARIKSILEREASIEIPSSVKLKKKRPIKNQINIGLEKLSYRFLGVDLYQVEGISHQMVLTLISELGKTGIHKFENSKAFSSFTGTAPNRAISGGKKLAHKKSFKSANRLNKALLHSANTIGNSKTGYLKSFHSKISYRLGRTAANKAVARKLSVIVYHMLSKKEAYKPIDENERKAKIKLKTIKIIQAKLKKYDIKLEDIQCVKV